jgi:hypothetical protein
MHSSNNIKEEQVHKFIFLVNIKNNLYYRTVKSSNNIPQAMVCVVSGFPRSAKDIFPLLECYTA